MRMKCIIVEGPQGCGKTNLANYLRENIPSSNLYRLAGNKDKSESGKIASEKMYNALLDYMDAISSSNMNLIFDRTFFSEQAYSDLGLKGYDFTDVYEKLLEKLGELDYDIHYISLYLENTNIYEERLKRKHHGYQAFSKENSVKQQNAYKALIPKIKKLSNVIVHELKMDDFARAYLHIDKIFGISPEENDNTMPNEIPTEEIPFQRRKK